MAKKKTEKKKDVIAATVEMQIVKLTFELKAQANDLFLLNQRIDNIIAAHKGCKKMKGL